MSLMEKLTLMVVEDDQDIRENLQLLLESEGYDVKTAINGQHALEVLDGASPAPKLILVDMMMPVMDGSEFIHRKAAHPDTNISQIPVIIVSACRGGFPQHQTVRKVIKKPFEVDSLLSLVRATVESI